MEIAGITPVFRVLHANITIDTIALPAFFALNAMKADHR